jgi:hypothetical protein
MMMKILYLILLVCLSSCKWSDLTISRPNAGNLGKASFNHSNFLVSSCILCHINDRPITIPIHGNELDCVRCHSAEKNITGLTTWLNVKTFDHSNVSNCITCHESRRPISLQPHSSGNWGEKDDCMSCHSPTKWNIVFFDHSKELVSCVECHRNSIKDDRPLIKNEHPSLKYNTLDCASCHNKDKWNNLSFNHHKPFPSSCINCHEKQRPDSHINNTIIPGMKNADCESCHTSSNTWSEHSSFDHEIRKPVSCSQCHIINLPSVLHPSPVGNYSKIDCFNCHTYSLSPLGSKSWTKIIFTRLHKPDPVACVLCHKEINDSQPINFSHKTGSRLNNDCKSCHVFDDLFKWQNFTNFNHTIVQPTERCDNCHNITTKLTSKPQNHKSTTLDCRSCHIISDWKNATFVHDLSNDNCISCHNSIDSVGKNLNHVPTINQCSSCHNQIAFKPTIVKTHSVEIIATCFDCHNGIVNITSKGSSHKKINTDCSRCHNPNAWTPAIFTHQSTDSICNSCHNSVFAPGINSNHIPTINQCSSCHDQTAFNPTLIKTHSVEKVTTCLNCHNGTTMATYKSINHIITTFDCSRCHSLTDWKSAKFSHISSDVDCISCHNGNVTIGVTSNHIPTINQCSSCHNQVSFKPTVSLAHSVENISTCLNCHNGHTVATYKSLNHASTIFDCNSCHLNTAWKPATFLHALNDINCSSCHNGTIAKKESSNHIPTSNQCSSCHSQSSFKPTSSLTHKVELITTCYNCHNGITTATYKTINHFNTILDCSACHLNTAWKPATFIHGVADVNCISCHDGIVTIGKNNLHIQTSNQCSVCHNQISFKPSTTSTHSVEIISNCLNCHNGNTIATSKNINTHAPTILNCSSCHLNTAWKPATFTHAVSDTNCLTCHTGTFASAKPVSHTLNGQCSACHNQINWKTLKYQTTYSHTNSIIPVSNLRKHPNVAECSKCHTNTTDSVIWTYPQAILGQATVNPINTCAGCHLNLFNFAHGQLTNLTNAACLNCHHTGYVGF